MVGAASNDHPVYRSPIASCDGFRSMQFEPLPGSYAEVRALSELWAPRSGTAAAPDTLLLTGTAASEASFKAFAPGSRVVHLATHGFYVGDRCDVVARQPLTSKTPDSDPVTSSFTVDRPVLVSGLALAGANRREEAGLDREVEDGIVTAEEIASLDLRSVEWIVLSGCETALGDLRDGEGVLGLRRAFRIAGAQALIMSLWRVEDEATRVWMEELYRARAQGRSTAEAVRLASLRRVEAARSEGKSTHPLFWGAFVAAGDWR
jgi:CHAT domain-containing protein